jgi:hypothetical protein
MEAKARFALILISLCSCATAGSQHSGKPDLAHPIEIARTDSLPKSIGVYLESYDIVLLGEMHGTTEGPAFMAALAADLRRYKRSLLVGLEISTPSQEAVNAFLEHGDRFALMRDPFFARQYQDGRSSRAMVDLLDKLRDLPGVRVACFDPCGAERCEIGGQRRDELMAQLLSSVFTSTRPDGLLILSGNIHAALTRGTPWDAQYRPMGYLMSQALQASRLLSIRQRYGSGEAWVCTSASAEDCKPTPFHGEPKYAQRSSAPAYFMVESIPEGGYGATVFTRQITASPPFGRFLPAF